MSVIGDMCMVYYLDGVFDGQVSRNEFYAEDIEEYFDSLVRIAKDYNIPFECKVSSTNCDKIRRDLLTYFGRRIAAIDLELERDKIIDELKNSGLIEYDEHGATIHDMDIVMFCDRHNEIVDELYGMVFDYFEENDEYTVF